MLSNTAERRSFALAGLLTCTPALRNLGLLDSLRSPRSRLALSVESPASAVMCMQIGLGSCSDKAEREQGCMLV